MRQDESNLICLLAGIGIGWLGFTADGQQIVRKTINTIKDKYVINNKKEGEQNDEQQ